jgi:hypothetical protein
MESRHFSTSPHAYHLDDLVLEYEIRFSTCFERDGRDLQGTIEKE